MCGVDGCAEWTGSTSVTRCCNLSSDEGAAARGMADCGGDGAPPKLEGRGGGRAPGGEEADPVGGCDSALDMAEGGGRVAAYDASSGRATVRLAVGAKVRRLRPDRARPVGEVLSVLCSGDHSEL